MVVVDEMWKNLEFHDFINSKLKQMASVFNYLKYVGFSDAVRVMLARIPSDRIVDYSEGDSDE